MTVRLVALSVICGLGLGACESARFGGGRAPAVRASIPEVAPEPIAPSVPSGSVISEPLPPPPGSGPFASADVPVMPGSPRPVETLGGGGPPPAAAPPSSRSAVIGGWTAREASGTGCRVNLASTPSLDLYRASASGCANKDLARITAWDFRDGEVYLFQPGGAVAARLRPASSGLTGVLAKSGAPLALTRS